MIATKVCAVVVRDGRLLMFRHPCAGWQLVKGSLERGEAVGSAAVRELFEEAGIRARVVADLGLSDAIDPAQVWSLQLCEPIEPVAEAWSHHCADAGGHVFEFFWHPLVDDPVGAHPLFVRAVQVIRERSTGGNR